MAKGFENALEKVLRKLLELNKQMADELDEYQQIVLVLEPHGNGSIDIAHGGTMFRFTDIEELMQYLDATAMKRLLMTRHQTFKEAMG